MPVLPLLALVLQAVRVVGDGECPKAHEVQAKLEGVAQDGLAKLERVSTGLRVALTDGEGTVLAERILPEASCAELAELVPLVLESWLSELAPPSLDAPALPPIQVAAPVAPATKERRWGWELSLAATGSAATGGAAPGGLLEGALGAGPLSARLWLGYDGPRAIALSGSGVVGWQRAEVGLGGGYARTRGTTRLELIADVVASEVFLQGEQLPSVSAATSFVPGVDLGLRLAFLSGPVRPWIQIVGTAWLREEVPEIQGSANTTGLPQLEVTAALGVAVGSP